MSPVETLESKKAGTDVKTTALMLRPDQIVLIDEVKAAAQRQNPDRSISRSEVVRDALDRSLIAMKAELEGAA